MTPEEYRRKHRRCRFCKYREHHYKSTVLWSYSWDICLIKDKQLSNLNSSNWKGIFCPYYEPRED